MARFSVTTGSVPLFSRQPSRAPYTMRSASCRLPPTRILFTSCVTSGELYTGSGTTGWRGAGPLRGMSALLLLRAVTAAGLLAVADTLGVQRTANDLVADAREVLHTTAANEHDRVLLQVVADARDVRRHLDLAAELHTSDLAQRGVRLLGGGGVHARAHAAPLRASLQRRRLGLARLRLAALSDQLLDRGHRVSPLPSAASCTAAPSCMSLCAGRPRSRGRPAPAVGRVVRLTVPPRVGHAHRVLSVPPH